MSSGIIVDAVIRHLYGVALRLYPHDFRVHFAHQMCCSFDLIIARSCPRVLPEVGGLVAGAAREWFAKLTTDALVRGRSLPDWRFMRPVGISKEVWFGGPPQSE